MVKKRQKGQKWGLKGTFFTTFSALIGEQTMFFKKFAQTMAVCGSIMLVSILAACGDDSDSGTSPDLAQNGLSSSAETFEGNGSLGVENDSTGMSQTDSLGGQIEMSGSSSSGRPDFFSDNTETTSSESVSSSSYDGIDPATVVKSTLTDERDGKVYKTVKIGEQTWMAENLKYDYKIEDDEGNVVIRSYCTGNEENCDTLGRLYTWSVAVDSAALFSEDAKGCGLGVRNCKHKDRVQGICPSGWHVPSDSEWVVLFETVGGENVAGYHLKSKTGWPSKNVYVIGGGGYGMGTMSSNGDDIYGFSACPTVVWHYDEYKDSDGWAPYWTSDERENDDTQALYASFGEERKGGHASLYPRHMGFLVRCVMD